MNDREHYTPSSVPETERPEAVAEEEPKRKRMRVPTTMLRPPTWREAMLHRPATTADIINAYTAPSETEQSETAKVDPLTATPEEIAAALARTLKGIRQRAERDHPSRRPSLPRPGAAYDMRPLHVRLAEEDADDED